MSALFNVAPALDTTPPVISLVSATSRLGGGELLKWTTNEASDSQVEYGATTAYGSSTTRNPILLLLHLQAIGGLAPGTTYHYRVRSRDKAGNLSVSADLTFKSQ